MSATEMLEHLCRKFGYSAREVRAPGKHQRVARQRAHLSYVLKAEYQLSYLEIAKAMRLRNHTSILAAVRRYVESQRPSAVLLVQNGAGL